MTPVTTPKTEPWTKADLREFAAKVDAAWDLPLSPALREIVTGAASLVGAFGVLREESKNAIVVAEMRSENNRKVMAMNEDLIARNYALTDAMERYEKSRRAARSA